MAHQQVQWCIWNLPSLFFLSSGWSPRGPPANCCASAAQKQRECVIYASYVIPSCYQDVFGLPPKCSASATTVNDMDQPKPPAPLPSLREALEASGARPNSRLSVLSRYVLDHQDELYVLKSVDGYSWRDIVAVLAQQPELAGISDPPLTVAAAKLAWSRMMARKGRNATTSSRAPPTSPFSPEPVPSPSPAFPPRLSTERQSGEISSQNRDRSAVEAVMPAFDIQPARPRSAPFAPNPSQNATQSIPSLLEADEVERRIADLAVRQGGVKTPPPEVL